MIEREDFTYLWEGTKLVAVIVLLFVGAEWTSETLWEAYVHGPSMSLSLFVASAVALASGLVALRWIGEQWVNLREFARL